MMRTWVFKNKKRVFFLLVVIDSASRGHQERGGRAGFFSRCLVFEGC